ncbi:Fic family protein [Rothia nasimurium]|uniref:Fic family protein n=1 Tax=Rothia nasimurium TaxID=85336 RepID=A0A4Y9F563_9MICC|nr:Fic family protein [Rothia nasimurium]MBF0808051.1 Fic family protein [Rothia nasimurium]TFU22630.1 Fic family protein [Rothia nasimurium]
MKKYRSLKSIFHQFDRQTAGRFAQERRDMGCETSFVLGDHTLFYTVTPQLLLLQEQILLNERTLEELAPSFPATARASYLYELITQEISATNEIEGVRSTRQEIQEALDAEPSDNKKFREIARLYLELSQGKVDVPHTLEEVRATYDRLFGSEIADEDRPDGRFFRAGPVYVHDGAGKIIHAGARDEEALEQQLRAMFDHLENTEVPFLLSRAVSHFMFEAAHPFYDGNGRFGRFFLSAQLQEVLSTYTVLALSHLIKQKKEEYHRAFTEVEEPLNYGEVTLFAHVMLGFIRDAQLELIDDFEAKKQMMQLLYERVDRLKSGESELSAGALDVLFILGQVHLFSGGRGIEWGDLAQILGKSRNTVRAYLVDVEQERLVERTSSRPLRVRLSEAGKTLLFPGYA